MNEIEKFPSNAVSAQGCGCDPGANYICRRHADHELPTLWSAVEVAEMFTPLPGTQPGDVYFDGTKEQKCQVDVPLVTRKQALADGLTHYFTGKPCPAGHSSPRYVSTRKCASCSAAEWPPRWERDRITLVEKSRARQRKKLPTPTRPCPEHCELCGGPSGKRAFHLDHDHTTNQFRGWLCGKCNTTLGKFGDDIAGLQKAVLYLRRNRSDNGGLPVDPAKRKEYPIATGVLDYFPLAITAIAHVSFIGNQQHNPGQPLRWDRSKSTDEADALMRHFKDRGTLDADGTRHTAKLAWRALAMLQKELEAEQAA